MENTDTNLAYQAHKIGARTTIAVEDLEYTLPDALAALAYQVIDVMAVAEHEGGYTIHPETFTISMVNAPGKPDPKVKALEVRATVIATLPTKAES